MADSQYKYIGSFPLQSDDTKTLLFEFEKFMKKLQAMQRQMINHVINTTARANKRHSLTTAEILQKLTEKGLNCLEGEPLDIRATRLAIQFCDPNSEDVTHIGIEDISIVQALEYGKNQSVTILAVLENQGTQYECHLIRADKEHNIVIEKTLREGMGLWNQKNKTEAPKLQKERSLTPRKKNFRVSLRQSSRRRKQAAPPPVRRADEEEDDFGEFGGFDDEVMDNAFGRLNDDDDEGDAGFGFGDEDLEGIEGFGDEDGDYAAATMFDTTCAAPPAPPPRCSLSGNSSPRNSSPIPPTGTERPDPTSSRSSLGSGADAAAPPPPRRRSQQMAPEPPTRREPPAPEPPARREVPPLPDYLTPEPPSGSVQYRPADYLEPERPLQKGPTYKVPNKLPNKGTKPGAKPPYAMAQPPPTAQQVFNNATGANAIAAVAAAVGANKTPTNKSQGRAFNNNMPFVVDMSKATVEKLINDRSKELGNGAFVIRNSESQPGEYTLSFQNSEMVTHMRIQKLEKKNGLHLFTLPAAAEAGGPWFKSLPSMVMHYQSNTIPGLGITVVTLGKPVAGHSAGAGQKHSRSRPAPAPAQSVVEEFVTEDVQYDMAQKASGGLAYHQHVPAGRGPGGGR